jgi:hypothetical protein
VRVLDVVDRVLVRLLLGQLDVEVDVDVRATTREEPSRGVGTDLREELVEGDVGTRPLGHRDLDAIAHKPDPAREDHLDGRLVEAHSLGGIADPGDRSVVIGAPDVDQVVEAPAELLGHVADIGGKVGRLAVRADHHPILVIAEGRRAEPERAVQVVQVSRGTKPLDCPGDPALVVQARLGLPDVEPDAESRQRRFDACPDLLGGPAADGPGRFLAAGRSLADEGLGECGSQVHDVVAVIPIVGHRLPAP